MQGTRFQRIQLTQIVGAGEGTANKAIQKATAFVQAGALPLRILIRNVSIGVSAFFSIDDVAPLNSLPLGSGPVYELPAGQADVFVLAPKQRMIGAADAPNCFIVIASSEALPLDLGIGAAAAPDGAPAAFPDSAAAAMKAQPIKYQKG